MNSYSMRPFIALGFAVLSATAFNAWAATITVSSTVDSGPGSLRDALSRVADGDSIDFSSTGTILLTGGELLVTNSVAILGPGAGSLAVDGNAASRVFHIGPSKTVTISSLTVTNGRVRGFNLTDFGGGIWNERSSLTVSNCAVRGNSSEDLGGGIFNDANLWIVNSTLAGNSAVKGGGIANLDGATVQITNSTLAGNSADYGGAILNWGRVDDATAQIVNSTLSDNAASFQGGGIMNLGFDRSASLRIINSTLSGNSSASGGGIENVGRFGPARLEIGNTILSAGDVGENLFNDSGTVTTLGYNLSSDGAGALFIGTGDRINIDPLLDPAGLQDNGGPTFTIGLLACSPAIDQGKDFSASPTEQRGDGFARTFDDPAVANALAGDGTDIGAFEAQAPVVDTTLPTIACPSGIVVNATSPTGAVVTFPAPLASDNCSVDSVASSPASGGTFVIGTTAVTSRAIDGSSNTNTCTFTVKVKSAAEQIADLIALVNGLPGVKTATKNALVVKLAAAQKALGKGNIASACSSLKDFIGLAFAQAAKKELLAAQSSLLIVEATRIRAVLACP
jgi:hypothetical protein